MLAPGGCGACCWPCGAADGAACKCCGPAEPGSVLLPEPKNMVRVRAQACAEQRWRAAVGRRPVAVGPRCAPRFRCIVREGAPKSPVNVLALGGWASPARGSRVGHDAGGRGTRVLAYGRRKGRTGGALADDALASDPPRRRTLPYARARRRARGPRGAATRPGRFDSRPAQRGQSWRLACSARGKGAAARHCHVRPAGCRLREGPSILHNHFEFSEGQRLTVHSTAKELN